MRRVLRVAPTPDERDVYRLLALPFIEPELREGEHEIRLAKAKKLPRLVQDGDLRGIIHAHTDRSDGVHTLEQMAQAARKTGLRRTARKFGTLSQALPLLPANRAKRKARASQWSGPMAGKADFSPEEWQQVLGGVFLGQGLQSPPLNRAGCGAC